MKVIFGPLSLMAASINRMMGRTKAIFCPQRQTEQVRRKRRTLTDEGARGTAVALIAYAHQNN